MKTSLWIAAALLTISSVVGCAQLTQTQPARSFTLPPEFDWTTEKWTADEKPYQRIRLSVDKFVKAGQDPLKLAGQYEVESRHRPTDPQKLFRWAYAAYLVNLRNPRSREAGAILGPLNAMQNWLIKAHSYEFTRLRFLMQRKENFGSGSRDLIPVGERLHARNPQDHAVNEALFGMQEYAPDIAQRRKAVAYAEAMLKAHPQDVRYHGYIGAAYYNLWKLSNNPKDYDRALLGYRTYLRLAPANAAFRKDAQELIASMMRSRDSKGHYHYVPGKS